MIQYILLVSLAICAAEQWEFEPRRRLDDPFSMFDRHKTADHARPTYMWPWDQLFKVVTALNEEALEETDVESDPKMFQVNINVRHFMPEDLKIKIKDNQLTLEGDHKAQSNKHGNYYTKHFIQRYTLPPGCKSEEVTAVLNENSVLTISAPRYPPPPEIPEREVPIQVRRKVVTEPTTVSEDKKDTEPEAETTTVAGKIRKKELKSTPKTTRDNEVTKDESENVLEDMVVDLE